MRDGGSTTTRDAGTRDGGEGQRDGGEATRDAGVFDGVLVTVTLDGVPTEGVRVRQGGAHQFYTTDANGRAIVEIDDTILGTTAVVATHPEARIRGAEIFGAVREVTIELERFDASDNPDYIFSDPGEPDRRDTTAQCAHCHVTINQDWHASAHRSAAKNTIVHDMYAGTAAAFTNAADCTNAGGRWAQGVAPGTGAPGMRCYLGDAALEAVNDTCNQTPCETTATDFAGCADCHAPAIDGAVGGRDLLEAQGLAYDFGVSCDVCHRVEQVVMTDPPGFGSRLRIVRPTEPGSPALGANGLLPITFGPSEDSPNPRMGSVQRDHFRDATLCAGCHQQETGALRPGDTIDTARWPNGRIPVQTTYTEWQAGPMSPNTPCQECHMPPGAERMNGADLQNNDIAVAGISGGWQRPPGAVRNHSFFGPRLPAARMLELAASVFVDKSVQNGTLTATVRVKNTGAGHAIPTGEPMRSIVLSVQAHCGRTELTANGGDAVPDFGGALASQPSTGDWTRWPGAQIGDVVRVVVRPGAFHDYEGPLRFGDGSFTPAERGLPVETVAGFSTITNVAAGVVTFDRPLPAGDVAYLVRNTMLAGSAGFGFARIMVDRDGNRQAPHFTATDVVSDNRLMPQASYQTTHTFASPCSDPRVTARLIYRSYPTALALERGWPNDDKPMVEVTR